MSRLADLAASAGAASILGLSAFNIHVAGDAIRYRRRTQEGFELANVLLILGLCELLALAVAGVLVHRGRSRAALLAGLALSLVSAAAPAIGAMSA